MILDNFLYQSASITSKKIILKTHVVLIKILKENILPPKTDMIMKVSFDNIGTMLYTIGILFTPESLKNLNIKLFKWYVIGILLTFPVILANDWTIGSVLFFYFYNLFTIATILTIGFICGWSANICSTIIATDGIVSPLYDGVDTIDD
jgi:hypothetical protein